MRVRLFGGLEIGGLEGGGLKSGARKPAVVLGILALAGPRGMRRERLCGLLWEGREEAQARASLRQALVELRRRMATDEAARLEITGDADLIALSAPATEVDIWCFDELLKKPDVSTLEAAAELFKGELLSGVKLPEAAATWAAPIREDYTRKALRVADELSGKADVKSAAIVACERLAERLLRVDASAEEAHRALIRIYQRQGKKSAAARQFRLCSEVLRDALDVEPERQTVALMELQAVHNAPTTEAGEPSLQLVPDRPSVVVMPFDNLSGPEDELLADGFVEEITANLSRVREFFVIARQSAFAGKERFADVRRLGEELGVRYVIQGTLRRSGTTLRITVRLVEAKSRALVWTERYEGSTTDVFPLQDRIAEQVAGAMHPALVQAEIQVAKRKPPDSLRAYELVLQAQSKMWKRVESENRAAIRLLDQATVIDPHYGRAYALQAWCHSQNVVYLWTVEAERERQLIRKAVNAAAPLIGDDPLAMTALGAALGQSLGEGERARSYVEAALALDPNSAWAWARLGWIIVQEEGFQEANKCFERALRLSPLDPLAFNFKFGIATCLGHMEQYRRGFPAPPRVAEPLS